MFLKKKEAELETLREENEVLKEENEALRHKLAELDRRFAKQWENFLSYDGTKQEGKLSED